MAAVLKLSFASNQTLLVMWITPFLNDLITLRHLAKVKSRQKEGSHRLDETIRHRACFFLNSFREDSNGFCLSYSNMRNQKMMPYMPYQHQLLTLTQHLLALSESCCLRVRNYRNTWNHRQMSSCPCMHHAQNCRSSRDLFLAGTPAATAMLRPQAESFKTKENKKHARDQELIQTWSSYPCKKWRTTWDKRWTLRSTTSGGFFKKWEAMMPISGTPCSVSARFGC